MASDPSDGVVSRAQVAPVLIAALTSDAAECKTLEPVAENGAAPDDLDPLFVALRPDTEESLDAVLDRDNMPISQEPQIFIHDLDSVRDRF